MSNFPVKRILWAGGLLAVLSTTPVHTARGADEWTPLPDLPQGVAGHAMAADSEGALWVIGGSFWTGEQRRFSNEIWHLPKGAGTWERHQGIPDGWAYGGVAMDPGRQQLYLAGGSGEAGSSAHIWRLSLGNGQLEEVGRLPAARTYCGAIWRKNTLWVLGGISGQSPLNEADAALYQITFSEEGHWLRLTTFPSSPSAGWVNPVLISTGAGGWTVVAGSEWSEKEKRLTPLSAIWRFHTSTVRWTQKSFTQTPPRAMSGVTLTPQRAFLVGGIAAQISAQTAVYESNKGTLLPQRPLPHARLSAAVAARLDMNNAWHIFVSGGEDRPRSRARTVWTLQLPPTETH